MLSLSRVAIRTRGLFPMQVPNIHQNGLAAGRSVNLPSEHAESSGGRKLSTEETAYKRASSHPDAHITPSTSYHGAQRTLRFTPKAPVVLPASTETYETPGIFIPASSPLQHLQSLLGSSPRHTNSQATDMTIPAIRTHPPGEEPFTQTTSRLMSPSSIPPDPAPSEYISSPASLHTITSSSMAILPSQSAQPSPVLTTLEDQSKFRISTFCAACHKTGFNFPHCPKCGETWCSKECRVKSCGGKRHVCSSGSR